MWLVEGHINGLLLYGKSKKKKKKGKERHRAHREYFVVIATAANAMGTFSLTIFRNGADVDHIW